MTLADDGNPTGEGEYLVVTGSEAFDTGTFDFLSSGTVIINTIQRVELNGLPDGKIYIKNATNPVEIRVISNGLVAYYHGDVDFISSR